MTEVRKPRIVRQSDVARLAGVSQSAVSRVVSGDANSRIPEGTRLAIQEAIATLGYAPNPVARNLRGSRTRLLGVHTFEPLFWEASRESFYFPFLVGIEERAEELGYDLVLFSSTGDGSGSRRIFREESNHLAIADASVLIGLSTRPDELARLWQEGYPFVHIGRRDVPGAPFPCIVPDYRSVTRELTGVLHDRGHRSMAYLCHDLSYEPYDDRRAGYRDAVLALGIEDDSPGFAEHIPGVPQSVVEAAIAGRVTAVVAENQSLAAELRTALEQAGRRVPEDVSVVVLEEADAGADWDSLRIPRQTVGRLAIDHLISMIGGEDEGWQSELVACEIVPGGTVADRPGGRAGRGVRA